jgi:DNA-binding transcriptional LysR family regulator
MDWDKLKTFHYSAELGSLTAAADKLGISQSAVSRQIAALEEQIGVPLFQRHARGLLLNGPGKALWDLTRDMAQTAASAERTLKDAREKVMGDLSVTAPIAFGSVWLAPRLVHFMDQYQELKLQLLLDDREYDLLKLEAECAVRLWAATHQDLIQRKILSVHVSLYAAPAYIERHGSPKKLEDLDNHRVVAFASSGAHTPLNELDWAIRAGRDDDKPRTPLLEINNVYGMQRAVESGLGIASLPDYMARGNKNLVKILSDTDGPNFDVYFIYPGDLRRSKRIIAFRDFLLQQAADWAG